MGGGQSTSTTQTNSPPEWARPLLELGAADAMKMYQSGEGYNVYRGPTQAQMSGQTLGGMNSLLAATGYTGAPVQNQTPQQMFPEVMKMLAAQIAGGKKSASNGADPLMSSGGKYGSSQYGSGANRFTWMGDGVPVLDAKGNPANSQMLGIINGKRHFTRGD
jgi:hypothetical protein